MYLADEHKIWVCKGEDKICMLPKMANHHGLIAGATGTGKTVTLKVLAESFSEMGVPVFLADIKGDVSGMCKAGESSEGFQKRLHKLGIENFEFKDDFLSTMKSVLKIDFNDFYNNNQLESRQLANIYYTIEMEKYLRTKNAFSISS